MPAYADATTKNSNTAPRVFKVSPGLSYGTGKHPLFPVQLHRQENPRKVSPPPELHIRGPLEDRSGQKV
jgi:hypothetical protein